MLRADQKYAALKALKDSPCFCIPWSLFPYTILLHFPFLSFPPSFYFFPFLSFFFKVLSFLLSVSLAFFRFLCVCQKEVHFVVLAAFCVINSTLTLAHKQINPGTLRRNFIKSSPVLSLLSYQASEAICLCERFSVFVNSPLVSPIILYLCLWFHSRVMTSFWKLKALCRQKQMAELLAGKETMPLWCLVSFEY